MGGTESAALLAFPVSLRIALAALAVFCAACLPDPGTPGIAADGEIRQILAERIDEHRGGVGIVVGVVEPAGRRVVAYGRLAAGGATEPDGDTIFEIGSITKTFTATALADLVTRGEVSLETPVQRLFGPDVRVPTRKGTEITLGHLAEHSSGLPRLPDNLDPADPANPYADYTGERLGAFLAAYELERDIGEEIEYSNLGAGLLGRALVRQDGTDYQSMLAQRVLGPLGMSETLVSVDAGRLGRLATGHDLALDSVSNWDIPALAGAGALRSTVADLLVFVEANLGLRETGLRRAMELAHRPRRAFPMPGMRGVEIGLGWFVLSEHGRQIVWHGGGTGGYRSFLGFDTSSLTGVVVLSNSAHGVDDLGFHLLDRRFDLKVPPERPAEAEIDKAVYAEYEGRYQLAKGVLVAVTREDSRLFIQVTGQGRVEVFPESVTRFFLKAVEAQVTFGRDDGGAVDHLVIHQHGADRRAVRLPPGVDSVDYGADEPISLPDSVLRRYVGRYQLQPGFVIYVTLRDGQLSARATGQSAAEIYPATATEFFYRVVDARITFNGADDGSVTSLTLHQAGRHLAARKLAD